jgi:hypothetical protein
MKKAIMKGCVLTISSVSLWITISTFAIAQDSSEEYDFWGTIRGSSCPDCDNYAESSIKGQMMLEALPVMCPNCAAYRVVSFTAEGEMFKLELSEGGGLIHFVYGDPRAYLSVELLVNDYPVSVSGEGEYWVLETGWPVLFFPDLSSGWFTLSFVAIPSRVFERCQDTDGDGYGSPASPLCPYPGLDCDDSNPDVNPGLAEVCSNRIDDNCDGQIDEGCGYSDVANAEASTFGPKSLTGSGVYNELTLLLIPMGAVIFLRFLRRKR